MAASGLAFKISLKEAKDGFFNPKLIFDPVARGIREANGHLGGRIRKTAQRLMKPGTPYRTKSQLSAEALKVYERKRVQWHIHGSVPGKEPSLGTRPSKPGTPPRYIQKGARRNIRSAIIYREQRKRLGFDTVMIGPWKFSGVTGTPVTQVHEHGGMLPPLPFPGSKPRHYKPRPYMSKALTNNKKFIKTQYKQKIAKAFRTARKERRAAVAA